MALGGALFGGLRHFRHILVDIVIKQRAQRFDMKHRPGDRQIALLQLARERHQLVKLGLKIGQDKIEQRIARPRWELADNLCQLRQRGAR